MPYRSRRVAVRAGRPHVRYARLPMAARRPLRETHGVRDARRSPPCSASASPWALAALVIAALAAAPPAALASGSGTLPGTWRRLPAAPVVPDDSRLVSAWTGSQLLVFGRAQLTPPWSRNFAAVYDPKGESSWREATPPRGRKGNFEGQYGGVWTGTELLVVGPTIGHAFNPATNRWRRLPSARAHAGGIAVWTGREMITWGGGCCGDASKDGAAYDPRANRWRALPPSPLAPSQAPAAAWDGHELIVVVGPLDPDGRPWPAGLARAAAYDPATRVWRRIAPPPAPRSGASAIWDGREVLLVGGTAAPLAGRAPAPARVGFAYAPASNRWRRLPAMGAGRVGAAMVWTGRRLLVWGGSSTAGAGAPVTPNRGLAYDPGADRWSSLPATPLLGRLDPIAVWTGRSMVVWGGQRPKSPAGTGTRWFADGAAFTPAAP